MHMDSTTTYPEASQGQTHQSAFTRVIATNVRLRLGTAARGEVGFMELKTL